ncbi:dTDP-4-dehydrorhamnose reductase [Salinihabitans flavidus]|uniref:dTDP-4-dehydrorhamnose reductase n=1 Tax=Salinihabitans flavidus TaxID=569882 RepID=A0A1H8V202_9RHOB|nr:dTDP-4-dehydrorhamnose reductase [Salinihabitans flavidus]SEP09257.1 dTDP-4-dehydrorhamnose reductase [Salinihabitans flavidus]
MKLLVFGHSGQVATELRALAGPDLEVEALNREVADLCAPEACAAIVAGTKADAVIVAAAYTAVDRAEEEEPLAAVINGAAPGAMARAAAARDLPFLHVSTDYVFDGRGAAAHRPDDPAAPINAYGRTKLTGEEAVRAAGGRHAILRTSWVFSAHGSNFVKTMLRLSESRDSLAIVADQIGGPTPARDIAATLVTMARAMAAGQGGGTYHYAGAPVTSWAGFAREIFELAEKKVKISDLSTQDYPTPAARPLNSRLDCATLAADFGIPPADWRGGLARVIADLKQEGT